MQGSARSLWITLLTVLPLAAIAGYFYALRESILSRIALPVLAAFLVEIALYLAAGFEEARRRLAKRFSARVLALWLTAAAAAPYCVYAVPLGLFSWTSLAVLGALAAALAFWYVLLPRRAPADAAFLVFVVTVVLARAFAQIYASPLEKLKLEALGQLMWIRTGIFAALTFRGIEHTGFRWLPTARDWRIGAQHYFLFLPAGVLLALALGFARFEAPPAAGTTLLAAAGTFAGMLWVVALSEEFFFRGLLQQWLGEWLRSRTTALWLASALFGLVHLPFRGFPNWRFAILAGVAGLFYGRAYLRAGNIRAAMVAHALVNTTWRMFT